MDLRVGQGYDIHPLIAGKKLILGGVEIDFPRGLGGHSDGDALIHAIVDAIIGAAGLGDIGHFFPDTDESIRGISSLSILAETMSIIKQKQWKISNIDATVIAEEPRLAPYIQEIRDKLASAMRIPAENVNIKAKTNEQMGEIGQGMAIAVHAVAVLVR